MPDPALTTFGSSFLLYVTWREVIPYLTKNKKKDHGDPHKENKEVNDKLASIQEKMGEIDEEVRIQKKFLFGFNGTRGFVNDIKEEFAEIKARQKEEFMEIKARQKEDADDNKKARHDLRNDVMKYIVEQRRS